MVGIDSTGGSESTPYATRFECPGCDGLSAVKVLGILGPTYRACPVCNGQGRLEMTYGGIGPAYPKPGARK
jgi:hypothetical protein